METIHCTCQPVYTYAQGFVGHIEMPGCDIHCPTEERVIELYGAGSEIHMAWRELQEETRERRRLQRQRTECLWALSEALCSVLGEPEPDEDYYDYD